MHSAFQSPVCARRVRTRLRRSPLALAAFSLSIVLASQGSANAQATPDAWTTSNIGDPALGGWASPIEPCVTDITPCLGFAINAGGDDIWGAADQFVFVWTPLHGDGAIVARVGDLQQTDRWAKAGLMLRESLAADARHASIFVTPTQGVAFQRRPDPGGSSIHTGGDAAASPRWLKLERRGSVITAYEAPDGGSWTVVGSDTLATGVSLFVGIAVTSHNAWARTTATVTDVSVATALSDATAVSDATALSDEWSFADVGAPAIGGAARSVDSAVSVAGSGADVWGGWDQFAFVYRPIVGDASIIARIADLYASHPWTKAGLMVRSSLSGDAPHAFAMITGGNGISFQGRPQSGGLSQQFAVVGGAAPAWLKVERRGVAVNAYTSADGSRWDPIGSAVIELSSAAYVGLAVTSHNSSQVASATFDGVTVRELSVTGNMRPVVAVTSPSSGSNFAAPATVTLSASATDADGSIGWVEFYSGSAFLGSVGSYPYTIELSGVPAGTHTVTAVAFDNRSESSTSGPVSFTVSAALSSSPVPPVFTRVAFTPSPDHATLVRRYVLDVFVATAAASAPVASQDLGLPGIVAGEISADVTATLAALPGGSYVATVTAVGESGVGTSEPAGFTR